MMSNQSPCCDKVSTQGIKRSNHILSCKFPSLKILSFEILIIFFHFFIEHSEAELELRLERFIGCHHSLGTINTFK